jgi:isoquinoline 1-oxidoreductase beta subunit
VRRRAFLRATSATGAAALVLGVRWDDATEVAAAETAAFRPSAWVAIGSDGSVRLTVHRSEMGQGVRTALPMMLAEELEADWDRIEVVQAMPGAPEFNDMGTGGSDSVASSWVPLRKAGAAAREMLVAAAAAGWGVAPGECLAERGRVVHRPSGRALGYADLAAAAARQPVPQDPPLKEPARFRIVGQRVRRHDGPRIVTGRASFGWDIREPGMLYASVARAPFVGGRAARWDAARARRVAGVRDVLAISSGVAVVAETTWAALQGRDAIEVAWEPGPHAGFGSDAFWTQLEDAAARPGVETRRDGDAPAALRGAARRLQASYRYAWQTHAPIEPIAYFADVRGDRCVLRGGTQNPQRVQAEVARLLSLPAEKVEVHVGMMGGAFGRRLAVDYAVEAAELSRAARAPVLVVWSRRDDLHHGHFQAASLHRMEGGLDAGGLPVAWLHRQASAFHNLGPVSAEELADPKTYRDSSWGQYDTPYGVPNVLTDYVRVDCPVRIGPWRAVFSPPATFARECFMDELARAGGVDPLELRLRLLEAGRVLEVGSYEIELSRYRRVLQVAAEKAGWGLPLPPRDGRRWGRGIAGNVYHGRTHVAQVAVVSVGPAGDVRVHRVVCAVDCGLAVNPLGVEGQVESGVLFGLTAALKGEITFRGGHVEQEHYGDYPILGARDAPDVEVHIVPSDARPYWMGEPPVSPAAPAVANAIFAATGRRPRRLPIRPADLA